MSLTSFRKPQKGGRSAKRIQGITEEEALNERMEAKSKDFDEKGAVADTKVWE